MTYAQFLSDLWHKIGHISSSELFNEADLVRFANRSFAYIEAQHDWSFLCFTRELTRPGTVNVNTFTLPTELFKVYDVTGHADTTDENGIYLTESGRTPDSDITESTFKCNVNTIQTSEEWYKLKVYANWGFERIETNADFLRMEMPYPLMLIDAAYNHCIVQMITIFIDNGYELARFHEGLVDKLIASCINKYSTHKGPNQIRVRDGATRLRPN